MKKLRKRKPPPQAIGWREWLAIPALRVDQIKAKIDTGARSSSLHAFKIRPFTADGVAHVSFALHPAQHRRRPELSCTARVCDERLVKSSNGHQERRYVIETEISLGGTTWPVELTLTNRDEMGFRMLLGRQSIRGRFLVDPNRSFIVGKKPTIVRNT